MVNPQTTVVDNKFIGGLKTEFTGINFPDDSCSETFDCIFSRTGEVSRRLGFNYEVNYTLRTIDRTGLAISTYLWKNVAGDGEASLMVVQVGGTIHFFRSSSATTAAPLSSTKLASTVLLTDFGSSPDTTKECQFADGNGYLFIFHPNCEPIAVSYSAGTLTGSMIIVRIRDLEGITESGVEDTFRPNTLSATHQYNLQNQGWTNAPAWTATSATSNNFTTGSHTWTIQSGLAISNGQIVNITGITGTSQGNFTEVGTVTSYVGTTLVLNVSSTSSGSFSGLTSTNWTFSSNSSSNLTTWNAATGNYPSNSDVWWLYKNTSGVFAPATTYNNITINAGPAPKGFYILDAFSQKRTNVSGIAGLTDVAATATRPATGCWFQGRVWYSGVNFQGFNEKIYFSQIIENTSQFAKCYQINDPTSEDRADLLASDGGVIVIQGTGQIYKLFPIVNGLLVFAERGVWFITGSQGIGFTANDYTITKISHVPTLSASSFVDVLGIPMWCNEDGIYTITTQQGAAAQYGGLSVTPITYGTIASFYQSIPLISKRYMKGYYSLLDYKVQWLYKNVEESSVTNRYSYTNVLNLDTLTNAFYPWTISNPTAVTVNSVIALGGSGASGTEPYKFKYLTTFGTDLTFSETNNTIFRDWVSPGLGADYTSYFITGYRVYTKGNTLGQLPYVDVHSVGGGTSKSYISARWDWTTSGNTGRWTQPQLCNFSGTNRAYQTVRRRIRGQGRSVQLKFSSYPSTPMSLIGWSTWVTGNPLP